jgi:endonuclease/exonuclease/phosphatase (EEP) superfamily protein YafD
VRRLLRLAPFLLVPWTWFLVRDLHPAADVVALGMPVLVGVAVLGTVVLAALRRRTALLAVAVSWLLFGLVVVVGPWVPRPGADPVDAVRVVAANTFGSQSYPPSVGADIAEQSPQVVVISELSAGTEEELRSRFDAVERAAPGRSGQPHVGVFTDLPVERLDVPAGVDGSRGVRLRIEGPSGPFVLYGLHLPPPRPRPGDPPDVSVREHRRIVDAVHDAIAVEDLPVVVAGDLNLVDRTYGYRQLLGVLDDAMRDGWVRPTARRRPTLPVLGRVDHVLVSESWCSTDTSIFSLTGSDHRGVAATVGPCP